MKQVVMLIGGMLTWSLAVASAASAASVYIPGGSAGEVLVVDATTDRVTGRIEGLPDVHGLGAAAGARYLVAGSYSESPVASASSVAKPEDMSQDEHAAHHAGGGGSSSDEKRAVSIVSVIEVADGSIVARLEVPGAVHHVAISPDGRYAIATHPNDDGVSVIDLRGLEVLPLVRTGASPNYVVFNADGSRAYVSNAGNGTISEIDTARWIVRRNFVVGEGPEHMAVGHDGKLLYVANAEVGAVSVLSLDLGEVVHVFSLGAELHGLDVSDDGGILFVSARAENKLVAIDLASGQQRNAPLGPAPYHLAVIRGMDKLYVSSRDEPKIWVVDQASLTARGTIEIRGEGHQMVQLP
jgi:dipeptidyl aminopeptidase/acylaminoacyl peptidase